MALSSFWATILEKLNNLFGYSVVEKIKLISFDDEKIEPSTNDENSFYVTNHDYQKKINNVKNEKIKKSLMQLSKVFKNKWKK